MEFFVATPYELDVHFAAKKQIVERVAQDHLIRPLYAPSAGGFDIDRTLELLKRADFVLGDLSYERPSCYFEIGFAQALEKPIDLIALDGTDLHQVIGREQVKTYRDLKDYQQLIVSLLKARLPHIVT